MKIKDDWTINLDAISNIFLDENNVLEIRTIECGQNSISFNDKFDGEGFCKNLKAKIDAYFEAKESLVMHQASLIGQKHELSK